MRELYEVRICPKCENPRFGDESFCPHSGEYGIPGDSEKGGSIEEWPPSRDLFGVKPSSPYDYE